MNKAVKILAPAAIAAIAVCACGQRKPAQDPMMMAQADQIPKVETYTASFQDVPQEDTYSSTVQAYAVNNVVPQSGNRISKVYVEVGDFVSKGQILAEMDAVGLTHDSTELVRLRGLFQAGGISQSDFEAVELAYKVSKASYDNLLENTVLRAPMGGVITARNYDSGDMYAMASPIYVVQQITPVKILVGISETDYTRVKKDDVVSITADAIPGRTFEGKVNRLYPTIDPATHTFTAEILVTNADRVLRPGMYARVTVTFATNHSIVIPDSAVIKQQGSGQRSVYLLQPDNTVKSVVVTLGRHFGQEYEILDGLKEGDIVVTKGHTALRDGSQVTL